MTFREYFEKLDEKEVDGVKQFYVENIDYSCWGAEYALMCEVHYKDGEIKHYCYPMEWIDAMTEEDLSGDFRTRPLDDAITLTESDISTIRYCGDITNFDLIDSDEGVNLALKFIEKIKYRRNNKTLCEALDEEERKQGWQRRHRG